MIRYYIKFYNQTISHSQREKAPQRIYLPSDIIFAAMNQDSLTEHPGIQILFEKYLVVAKKHISSKSNEECKSCEEFSPHNKSHTS